MKKSVTRERYKLLRQVEKLLESPMIFLGFVWLALLVVELIWGLPSILEKLSIGIWVIFIVDFLLKFLIAPHKSNFLKKNWLTAVSLLIPALRVLRLLRILRIARGVRLIRIVSSLNRSTKSLGATMNRRGFKYVVLLTLVVTFGGAAGMFAIEQGNTGFENYGMSLWWTAMRVVTAGSEYWPVTAEGRVLAFIIAIFGYAVFGYVTATLASYFIGRDAEEQSAPVAGAREVAELKTMIEELTKLVEEKPRV